MGEDDHKKITPHSGDIAQRFARKGTSGPAHRAKIQKEAGDIVHRC